MTSYSALRLQSSGDLRFRVYGLGCRVRVEGVGFREYIVGLGCSM